MSAAPSTIHRSQIGAGDHADTRFETPPPAPLGPSTWHTLYYACIAAAALVGLGTILNGGVWTDAVLRMFITLLGGSILVIAFLTFVIIPLHVSRYERLLAAQKKAQIAAREKRSRQQREEAENSTNDRTMRDDQEPVLTPLSENSRSDSDAQTERAHQDQAASLRRMAAADAPPVHSTDYRNGG